MTKMNEKEVVDGPFKKEFFLEIRGRASNLFIRHISVFSEFATE